MNKADWVWMPHPGHFICANDCKFVLCTYVGGFIVSTVGEMLPDSQIRDIIAESRGVTLKGKGDYRRADFMDKVGFMEIGSGTYETMVFKAKASEHKCCPWAASDFTELDCVSCNDPGEAYEGHMLLCEKWSSVEPESDPEPNQQ